MAGGERSRPWRDPLHGMNIMDLKPSLRARKGLVLCPRAEDFKESNVLENLKIGGYLASPSQARQTLEYVFKLFPLEKLKRRIGDF